MEVRKVTPCNSHDEDDSDPFPSIPREIFFKILLFAGPAATAKATGVSKTWKQFLNDDYLWKQFCVQYREKGYNNSPLPVSPQITWKNHLKSMKETRALARRKKLLLKIVLMGSRGVGKTCLFKRCTKNRFDPEEKPTIGSDFESKELGVEDRCIVLQIWDCTLENETRPVFYRGIDVLVIVVDLSKGDAASCIKDVIAKKQETTWQVGCESHLSAFVVGTKADLLPVDDSNSELRKEEQKIKDWCKQQGLPFLSVSAKENQNVTEMLHEVAKAGIVTADYDPLPELSSIDIEMPRKSPGESCALPTCRIT